MVPSAEMVSFSNTGTEATMEAVRVARAFTGGRSSSSSKATITDITTMCSSVWNRRPL